MPWYLHSHMTWSEEYEHIKAVLLKADRAAHVILFANPAFDLFELLRHIQHAMIVNDRKRERERERERETVGWHATTISMYIYIYI